MAGRLAAAYRADFRKLFGRTPAATIQLYLAACSEEMRPFGVWLLGKCVNRFMLLSVPDFRWDFSEKVRKQVARTLWRLEAWHLLDEMAAEFPNDEKVQWYAAVRSRRPAQPMGDRLRRFSEHVDHSHAADLVGPSRMSFWSRFDPWMLAAKKAFCANPARFWSAFAVGCAAARLPHFLTRYSKAALVCRLSTASYILRAFPPPDTAGRHLSFLKEIA